MAQSPIIVIDGTETAAVARVEINGALEALATLSSGATAPSTTFSGMFWHDTSTGILKIRSEADDAWINVGYLDQSNNEFKPYVGGMQVDTQSTADWEAGTSTTEGIVSPAKIAAAIDDQLADATAGLSYGAVGTYVFAGSYSSTIYEEGSTYAGSTLKPAGAGIKVNTMSDGASSDGYPTGGGAFLSGTWRAMGRSSVSEGNNRTRVTLFLRVS